ncbi:CLUMA_CG013709, isoform A [Clunio marinus]|uniref:CLUMA_CG013709, isoform A n=1 Tax=Clunio marinus TaxID=568069 RepID=A0A1J1IMY1_9DIPT|nr:CLUMA_CG013709, isoform A [Clunio marinus]
MTLQKSKPSHANIHSVKKREEEIKSERMLQTESALKNSFMMTWMLQAFASGSVSMLTTPTIQYLQTQPPS